jgi:hypothetical protein
MSQVTDEVDGAIARLGVRERVRRVSDAEAERVNLDLLDTFVVGGDRRWWWEAFRGPTAARVFDDGSAFRRLVELVPNAMEECWFVVEDDDAPFYPVWEATPADAAHVIGECFAFEYYIVPKDKRWLLCENHHNRVVGVGEEVISAMQALGGPGE